MDATKALEAEGRQTPSILMLCTTFGLEDNSRDLTRELADALAARGAMVHVCFIDWSSQRRTKPFTRILASGVEVLVIPARQFGGIGRFAANASKWLFSSWFAKREIKKQFGDREVDLLLTFSPLMATAMAIVWAKRHFRCRAYAYIVDFFPFHHRAAGLKLGGRVGFRVGLALENQLMRRFEVLACMSPAGIEYLKTHYQLEPTQRVRLLYLWGDTSVPSPVDRRETRCAHGLPLDAKLIIFGGQITEGRGIEELLEVAWRAAELEHNLVFLFMGQGRLTHLIEEYKSAGGDNVILKPPVNRENYLHILSACDVGLVSTVANTGVPTFPSKTIDYLRAGIPIVASVENTTDYGEFVEKNGFGVATVAGDPDALLGELLQVVEDPCARERMSKKGREALSTFFGVDRAAQTILEQAFGGVE